jgi:hypothetical protein
MPFELRIRPTVDAWIVDGVPCRVWLGTTPGGVRVRVLVALIEADDKDDQSELEHELIDVTGAVDVGGDPPASPPAKA